MALHEVLQAVLKEAAADILGTAVNAQGELVTPPKVAQFFADYEQLQEDVVDLKAQLTQALGTITQLTSLVNSKASQNSLNSVSQRVTTLSTTVDGKSDETSVAQRLQAIDGLDSTQSAALTQLQQLFSGQGNQVTTILAKLTTLDNTTAGLRSDVDSKAPSATVSNLAGQVTTVRNAVNDATTGLAATNALATTNATGLATANTAIGNRLRKDQADATPFPLTVPVAASMENAVRKSELVGGIQRPYRVFQNVGATPVPAYVRSGQVAAITDGLGLGQVYALTNVRIKTIAAPLVASTIKLFSGGVEVYTTTVALATIPAVGKTLDLLALTGASLPADIVLPATLTATSSAGTFEIIADGILK